MAVIIEGLLLSVILYLICLWGIRNGAVHMVFLYEEEVQKRAVELGLITQEKIRSAAKRFKISGLLFYFGYTVICVFVINGARGFNESFLQFVGILLIMGIFDRIVIDIIWVGHTKAWIIPGTEDLMPYIPWKCHLKKWGMTLIAYPVMAAVICFLLSIFFK